MGRPSRRAARRRQLVLAFAEVLADHGYAGATIARVAAQAKVAPGLVHHHFDSKEELLHCLLKTLVSGFRRRLNQIEAGDDGLLAYGQAALALGPSADPTTARCWVGVFAESLRSPTLLRRVRRLIDGEVRVIQERSGRSFSSQQAGALVAFVVGALVVGAFAPKKTAGFALPGFQVLVEALRSRTPGGQNSEVSF